MVTWTWKKAKPSFDNINVSVRRNHEKGRILFEIEVSALVHATPEETWAVLTDYERLHEFVPHLLSSKLLSRTDAQAVVEQKASVGFLFMRKAIHLVVQVTEQPFSTIKVELLDGNLKRYASHWQLAPADPGSTRIDYRGSVEPDFFVPLLLGRALAQLDVEKMLAAVVAEVERRNGPT